MSFGLAQMLKLSFAESKGSQVNLSFSREMCIGINAVRKEKGMGKKKNNVLVSPVTTFVVKIVTALLS